LGTIFLQDTSLSPASSKYDCSKFSVVSLSSLVAKHIALLGTTFILVPVFLPRIENNFGGYFGIGGIDGGTAETFDLLTLLQFFVNHGFS
jgi:hypothetical protein